MLFKTIRAWNWPLLGAIAFCALSLTGATEGSHVDKPWPVLLSSEPVEIDADFAKLQLRATITLARLMESDHAAE